MGKRGVGDVFLTAFFPRPLPHRFLFVLGSAFARLNLVLYEPQKKKDSKRTASYAGYCTASFFFPVTFGKRPYSSSFVKCCYPKEIVTKIPKEVVTVPTCQQFENLFTRFESPCPASAKQIAFSRENIKRYVRHFQKKS